MTDELRAAACDLIQESKKPIGYEGRSYEDAIRELSSIAMNVLNAIDREHSDDDDTLVDMAWLESTGARACEEGSMWWNWEGITLMAILFSYTDGAPRLVIGNSSTGLIIFQDPVDCGHVRRLAAALGHPLERKKG